MENWLKMQDKMNWKMDGGEMCVSVFCVVGYDVDEWCEGCELCVL